VKATMLGTTPVTAQTIALGTMLDGQSAIALRGIVRPTVLSAD
jgi:hypothetical protein